MSKIQINLELDSNKPNELKIVAKMLLELAGAPTISEAPQAASDQQEVNESLKEEAAPKKRSSRAKPEQDEEASEEVADTEETPASEAAAEEDIKLDDLRASLSLKVKSHRDEIKTKLTELGASNLTTLDAGKYADMNDFLKGLK